MAGAAPEPGRHADASCCRPQMWAPAPLAKLERSPFPNAAGTIMRPLTGRPWSSCRRQSRSACSAARWTEAEGSISTRSLPGGFLLPWQNSVPSAANSHSSQPPCPSRAGRQSTSVPAWRGMVLRGTQTAVPGLPCPHLDRVHVGGLADLALQAQHNLLGGLGLQFAGEGRSGGPGHWQGFCQSCASMAFKNDVGPSTPAPRIFISSAARAAETITATSGNTSRCRCRRCRRCAVSCPLLLAASSSRSKSRRAASPARVAQPTRASTSLSAAAELPASLRHQLQPPSGPGAPHFLRACPT